MFSVGKLVFYSARSSIFQEVSPCCVNVAQLLPYLAAPPPPPEAVAAHLGAASCMYGRCCGRRLFWISSFPLRDVFGMWLGSGGRKLKRGGGQDSCTS